MPFEGLGRRAARPPGGPVGGRRGASGSSTDASPRLAGWTSSSTWRRCTGRSRSTNWTSTTGKTRWRWTCAPRGCARARPCPHMRRVRGGRIVNFSDWVARSGRPRYPGYLAYYVAKAGVIALTEALALELAPDQILVNAVAPGPIVAPESISDEEFAQVERATPLGRWGGEIEIAKDRPRARRKRFHHGRDDPSRRRAAREIERPSRAALSRHARAPARSRTSGFSAPPGRT